MTDETKHRIDLDAVQIVSERLTLVPMRPVYREDVFREFTDEITTHMYPPTPKSIEETDAFIEKVTREREAGTDLVLAILREGEFTGCTGIHRINTRTPELGIWVKKGAHGNAYGKEAVTALKEWVDAHIDYDYIEYPVVAANVSSRKIAESLGGVMVKEFNKVNGRGEDREMIMYHIKRA